MNWKYICVDIRHGTVHHVNPEELGLTNDASDNMIKGKVEQILELPFGTLDDYRVERYPTSGTIIISPGTS